MFELLSEKQNEIVFSTSTEAVVRACPGSGKTFTVAARLAHKLEDWSSPYLGIACISFTNVAWQEIEKYLPQFGVNSGMRYPHFLGTIDSFINQYIFLPFGHLVMESDKRPTMVGEPYSPWSAKYYSEMWFDKVSIDISDNFFFTQPHPLPHQSSYESIFAAKKRLLSAGFANQQDANFFALKILRSHPEIAACLAVRFPTLLVDEAQDTTEIQMAIFNELFKSGLKEILLVGDPDQAIFEWNTADPKTFSSKCEKADHLLKLNECRRSSQKICDFVYRLSTLPAPAIACAPGVSDCEIEPIIVEYSSKLDLVNKFLKACKESEISLSVDQVALLSRTKTGVNELVSTFTGKENVQVASKSTYNIWKDDFFWCKNICEGKYLIDQNRYKDGYKLIERGFYLATNGNSRFSVEDLKKHIETAGFLAWRKTIHELIESLPDTNINIAEWLTALNFTSSIFFDTQDTQKAIKQGYGDLLLAKAFDQAEYIAADIPVRIGTIHSAKGETFEAVLVVIGYKTKTTKYSTILGRVEEGNLLEEELRILYVALTRPRRLLMFGVPEGNKELWSDFLTLHRGDGNIPHAKIVS